MNLNEYISVSDAAKILALPYHIVMAYVKSGVIDSRHPNKKYYLKKADVLAFDKKPAPAPVIEQEQELDTRDTYLAAAILYKGIELASWKRDNQSVTFTFKGSGLFALRDDYFANRLQVDAYNFISALKTLKTKTMVTTQTFGKYKKY